MGFVFRKTKSLGSGARLNVSKHGASVSKKAGPITLNSRGRARVRLGKGISFRFKI